MRHVLSALVHNTPGVLAQVSGMLATRGFNIDSLAVGETEDPELSRMTFVVRGDDAVLEQVRKQLDKLISVVQVDDFSEQDYVERDLIRITQIVRICKDSSWPATVTGTFRALRSLVTGLATQRVPEDDIIVPTVHFLKDNGELSSVALDEQTRVEIVP